MSHDNNDLQNLADELSRLFKIEKGLQLGRTYKPHPKSNKNEYWLKAAGICLDLGARPLDYVKSAFSYNSVTGGPYPSIYGGKAIKRYYGDYVRNLDVDAGSSVLEETVRYEIKSVFQACHQRLMRTGVPIRDTLADVTMPFPPYVRLALSPGDPTMFDKYGNEVEELSRVNPALSAVLEKLNVKTIKIK